jgi:hypothetical protein
MVNNIPVGLSGCDRNGLAGNCGTDNCDTLMEGDCELMDDFDQQWLYDLGVIEIVPIEPKISPTNEDAYDRAMEILL